MPALSDEAVKTVLWITMFLTMGLILWIYYTRRALLEGKRSGWGSALVLSLLTLLNIPLGTLLAIPMFIGLFDKEVREYFNKEK